MPTRNVNLTEHLDQFIESGITSGRFSNASEVVREGLRLLEQREQEDRAKIEWLRSAAKEGFDDIDRGNYVTLNSDEEIDDFVDQVRREVSENSPLKECVAKSHVQVTDSFRRDLADVQEWTVRKFGGRAAIRYDALIKRALKDIGADPARPGSGERPELMVEGARTYHISLSRNRVVGPTVKEPRHFVLYRHRLDGVIEVARILHDSCDLARHLPAGYGRTDD